MTLKLSVGYRGCGIPVAWKIVRANQAEGWKAHWLGLLQGVARVVPADWQVQVMADRGLDAPWLSRGIQAKGWHPFVRVKEDLVFQGQGEQAFRPLRERLARRGRQWQGKGRWSEQGETIEGTLLMGWEHGSEQRLAVVSDLEPEEAQVAWSQMRFWIEDEDKDHQRGALHWEQTRMTDPARAERLYLAMAVAMPAAVLLGGALEAQQQEQGQQPRRSKHGERRRVGRPARPWRKPRGREQSCLERGCQAISAAAVRADEVPVGQIVAESWPSRLFAVGNLPSSWVRKRKHKHERKRQRTSQQAEERRKERAERKAREQAKPATRRHERRDRPTAPQGRQREEQEARRTPQSEERKREQEDKRARRQRTRSEREQERERRVRWHEEIRQDRERRQKRQQERATGSRAASRIVPLQEALAPLPQPP